MDKSTNFIASPLGDVKNGQGVFVDYMKLFMI